jgi:hypothetical protein
MSYFVDGTRYRTYITTHSWDRLESWVGRRRWRKRLMDSSELSSEGRLQNVPQRMWCPWVMDVPELSHGWTWNCGSYCGERASKWTECHWRTVLRRISELHTLLLMDSLFKNGDMFQKKCRREKCLRCLKCLVEEVDWHWWSDRDFTAGFYTQTGATLLMNGIPH